MLRTRLVIFCVFPVLSGFLLTGCGNSDELNSLRGKVDSLESDVRVERSRNEDLGKRVDTSQRELGKMKLQLQDSQADRDKLNDTLKKLDKEFSDYKQKYKAALGKQIPGFLLPDVTINKRTFKGLVVARMDDESATCNTPEGIIRIKKEEVPAELAALLGWNQKTETQSQVPNLLQVIQDHIDGKLSSTELNGAASIHGAYRQYADVLQSVALVRNDEALGTGFIGKQDGVTYFFTCAHVAGGKHLKAQIVLGPDNISTLDLPKEMEISDEEEADDVVRFEMPNCKIPALQIAKKTDRLMPDEWVMALGNSEGAGVVPCIKGRTGGVGIYWVEIDAQVTHGNSGCPVVLEGTNKVIGIATKYQHALSDHAPLPGSANNGIRRLCLRPERVEKWRHVSVDKIVQEAESIRRVETDSKVLASLMEFHLTAQNGTSMYSANYLKPKFYLFKDSELAAVIAHHLTDLETNLKDDRTKFEEKKNYWNDALRKKLVAQEARDDSVQKELKAAQKKVRDHVALFADAVAALYEVGINDVNGNNYSQYDRRLFKEVAKVREKVIEDLRKHFSEEVRQFSFDAF